MQESESLITGGLVHGSSATFTASPEDIEWLMAHKWHYHSDGYAQTWLYGTKTFAHRMILERVLGRKMVRGELVDHINRDVTDNRRENLRLANKSINAYNTGLRSDNTSGCKGVYRHWPPEYRDKGWAESWNVRVHEGGIPRSLGYFKTKELAIATKEQYLATTIY